MVAASSSTAAALTWGPAVVVVAITAGLVVLAGLVVMFGRSIIKGANRDQSLVRGWITLTLVAGLVLFWAVTFTLNNPTLQSTVTGALTASTGAAIAFYYYPKNADRVRRDILDPNSGIDTVPQLIGDSVEQVTIKLANSSFKLEVDPASSPLSNATVSEQRPPGNSLARKGTAVVITLAPQRSAKPSAHKGPIRRPTGLAGFEPQLKWGRPLVRYAVATAAACAAAAGSGVAAALAAAAPLEGLFVALGVLAFTLLALDGAVTVSERRRAGDALMDIWAAVVDRVDSPRIRTEPHREPVIAEPPRWILAKVYDTTDEANPQELNRAFRAEAPHEIVIMVGRSGDWEGALSATGRPEESVDSKLPAGPAELAVMLFIPALGVSDVRRLRLPTTGPSDKVRFWFTAPSAGQRVDGSISLLRRGKILQTAILSGSAFEDPRTVPPGFEMTFRLAVIRPVTNDVTMRPSFDAALLTGRKDTMPVAVGVLDTETVIPFRTRHLARVVDKIRVQLKVLTEDPAAFVGLNSDASVALLLALARQGRDLYELLGSKLEEALPGRDLSRIQVVLADPSDFIPVEFIYDYPTPSQDAGLCSNWQKALDEGRCDPKHHPPAIRPQQAEVVCPLGFWGLKKVIERQAIDADDAALVDGKDFAIRAEPTAERPSLDHLDSALFAWSDRVNATVQDQSDTVLETLDTATGNRAVTARTWEEWVAAISERGPSLLVLLSHTVTDRGTTKLEIGPDGTGSRCERIEVVQEWVKREPTATPVVLLLGCDTAVARNDPQTFVARFRDVGAALVVGTIVPVLGEHAAPVANALVQTLHNLTDSHAHGGSNGLVAQADNGLGKIAWTFGDAMVAVRRQLLASGELTALCVTAFGDASWRLGGQSADADMTCSG